MLDAGAAVAAAGLTVTGPTARITFTPSAPTAGSVITLDSSTSTAPSGTTITSTQWTLVSGGGIISGIANGGTIATSRTATLTPTAAGSFTVSLRVTDGQANSGLASQTITVAAAPVPTGGLGGGNSGSGGGGGALSLPWLLLLALAVGLLLRTAPRRA
jgi:serine protease